MEVVMGLKFIDKKTGKIKFYWEDGKDAPFMIEDDTEDDTEEENTEEEKTKQIKDKGTK
jgi:hypothetical protein